jgi:hypothetical protein
VRDIEVSPAILIRSNGGLLIYVLPTNAEILILYTQDHTYPRFIHRRYSKLFGQVLLLDIPNRLSAGCHLPVESEV